MAKITSSNGGTTYVSTTDPLPNLSTRVIIFKLKTRNPLLTSLSNGREGTCNSGVIARLSTAAKRWQGYR